MQLFRLNKKMFLRSSLICFICLFSDLHKKVASFILFICQNQNINIFILKMNKKGASLVFDEIKKWPHLFFGGKIENKNKNLPASSVFFFSKKWPEKHLFILTLNMTI